MLTRIKGKSAVATAVVVAGGIITIGGGAAVGSAVYDANNAHKVDGKHAVSATPSANARKNKLVATNKKGRLPNNIIKKAPNANKLDGLNSSAFARKGAFAHTTGGAASSTTSNSYVYLPGATADITMPRAGTLVIGFTAESYCTGGSWCSVRILVDGAEAAPPSGSDFAFDSPSADKYESNAMTRVIAVGAGDHTVRVQYAGVGGSYFRLDDWALTADGKVG